MRQMLAIWLELSLDHELPPALLLYSRALCMGAAPAAEASEAQHAGSGWRRRRGRGGGGGGGLAGECVSCTRSGPARQHKTQLRSPVVFESLPRPVSCKSLPPDSIAIFFPPFLAHLGCAHPAKTAL
jgi:hypothetical protein